MYKPTLILIPFFSLVFPVLATPIPVPNVIDGLAQRDSLFVGQGAVYDPIVGSCGTINSNDQMVVAIPAGIFGNGDHCGKQVNIATGNSVQATVVDKCYDCGEQGIDMSEAAFHALTGLSGGTVIVSWNFI